MHKIENTEKVEKFEKTEEKPKLVEPKPMEPIEKNIAMYPDLKRLFVDTESETLFNFYLPSSLALCKKVGSI